MQLGGFGNAKEGEAFTVLVGEWAGPHILLPVRGCRGSFWVHMDAQETNLKPRPSRSYSVHSVCAVQDSRGAWWSALKPSWPTSSAVAVSTTGQKRKSEQDQFICCAWAFRGLNHKPYNPNPKRPSPDVQVCGCELPAASARCSGKQGQ